MRSFSYYNENDPKAAAWLRELIRGGYIADGEVDERSIEDVRPSDLRRFTQCHFFAGIGGWSAALRLAGWPDDRPVWTGSCPCQPFSAAGKRAGTSDERHLWPTWQWLIGKSNPSVVFGEQVASKDGISWLDIVSTDMEGEGYAIAPVVLPACGFGASHIRQRLWFVAQSRLEQSRWGIFRSREGDEADCGKSSSEFRGSSCSGVVAHDARDRRIKRGAESVGRGAIGRSELGKSSSEGSFSSAPTGIYCGEESSGPRHGELKRPGPVNGFWSGAEWINCRDGKARPIKPGTFPLAHGISHRVAKLRGIGNAIVPQVAAEVIKAYMDHV